MKRQQIFSMLGVGTGDQISTASLNPQQIEEILALFVGTKQIRLGSLPAKHITDNIRQSIQQAVDLNLPIPVIVPWGGRKTIPNELVDVAEISAILTLVNLDREVKNIYPLGLQMNVRIEDTGAFWLYRNDHDLDVRRYSYSMMPLINILREECHICPVMESSMMDRDEYFCHSEYNSKLILDYLDYSTGSEPCVLNLPQYRTLMEAGWKGTIPAEQREFYYERYKAANPDITFNEQKKMLADYLGGAKARYDLEGRCEPASPIKSIQITFVPPIPGAPDGMFSTTLYYRTIPMCDGRSHIAAWRGKGYVFIDKVGSVKTKLCSWWDFSMKEKLQQRTLELVDPITGARIRVKADYFLECQE